MVKSRMGRISLVCAILGLIALFIAIPAQAGVAPIVPHIIYWNGNIATWSNGAPWIKLMTRDDIVRARSAGAVRIYYRPYEVPGRDDGQCNDGAAMATAVLNLLSTVPVNQWPDAISYRNEFCDTNPTPQQFIPYYDTLRAGGYNGMIIYGSYSVGWPGITDWGLPQVMAAANKADGIETHQYFDMTVAYEDTWLCRREVRDIGNYPYLLGKPWFIGEFASGPSWCPQEDPQCRGGWSDRGKLSVQQYTDQMVLYRANAADQVKAIFVFTDGDNGGWPGYPVCGTGVGDWMKNNTWTATATICGTVKDGSNNPILGATVATTTGNNTCTTNSAGRYFLLNVTPGTWNVKASMTGYTPVTNNISVSANNTATTNFVLNGGGGGTGSITGYVKDVTTANAISGATVQTNTGGYSTTTAADGSYTLSNVAAGTYNVTASKTNYVSLTNNGVVVTNGNSTPSSFNVQNTMNTNTPTGTNNSPQATTVNTDTFYGVGFEGTKATDGVNTTKWCTTNVAPPHWLALDLGQNRTVNGFVVRHASSNGESTTMNTKNFSIQSATSINGPWSDEVVVDNSAQAATTTRSYDLPKTLRYVRLYITNAGVDNYARIYEFQVWCGSCSVPSITTQPSSQTKNVGDSVTFSVTATGATSYQWRKGGSNISGATASTYTIASVATGDAGSYDNVVTNSCGSVTSSAATLTVNGSSGSITGYVKDLTNVAISGATVSTNTGGYTTTSAADGTYTLSNVTAATYNVTASKSGYNSLTNNGVVVTGGQAATSNFNLQNTMTSNTPSGTNNALQATSATADTVYGTGCEATKAIDGVNTAGSKWVSTGLVQTHWLALDLGQNRTVNGFIVKMPGQAGEATYYNAKNFSIQSATSLAGPWSDEVVIDNTVQDSLVARSYVNARTLRYVRLYITNPGIDNWARINEFEVWCGSCSVPSINTQPSSMTRNVGESATFSLSATNATSYQWRKGGSNITGATGVSYTIGSVVLGDAGNFDCVVTNACGSVTSNTATLTVNSGGSIASEAFESMPSWTSTFDASWGSAATWSIVSGGQTANQLQAYRASQGSSEKVKVYTVPTNTNITISIYLKCPSYGGGAYWVETSYKLGSNTAQDFDTNAATWTPIQNFSNTGANGNGNVWTQYTATLNTGSSTQISIGFKHGGSSCVGPTMGWDTLLIQ